MENTENKKKEEINVGDYVKVKSNLFVTVTKNIYASICKVVDKYGLDGDINSPIYIIRTCDRIWYEVAVTHYSIEKVEPDVEMLSQIHVIDEKANDKIMNSIYFDKDALKDVKTAMEVQDFIKVTSEMRELYKRKNHDYGNSFGRSFHKYGLISAITRMSDKWERIDSLCQKQAEVKDESVRDTLIDLANYCVMTIIELDKKEPNQVGESFVTRLEEEWQELNGRIKKLSAFLKSQKVDSISEFQRELLNEQLTHMTAYRNVLKRRKEDILQKLEADSEQKEG